MANELEQFDQFYASAIARLEMAQSTDEVIEIHDRAKALAAAARAMKDREIETKAGHVKQQSLRRLGKLMAAQRDAGLMEKGGGDHRGKEYPGALSSAGIDKNLAKAARKECPEDWPPKPARPVRPKMTKEELVAEGRSPATERYKDTETGKSGTRIKFLNDDLSNALARIAELEADNARLKNDLEAMLAGDIMRLSSAAMTQRKAMKEKAKTNREVRLATGTAADDKTKEMYEDQIKSLKTQLGNTKSKVAAFMANGKTVLNKADRKAILVCLHPDGVIDEKKKKSHERAFQLFSSAIPEPEF